MGCLSFLKTPTQQLFEAAATNDIQLAKHALHHHNVANTINKVRAWCTSRLLCACTAPFHLPERAFSPSTRPRSRTVTHPFTSLSATDTWTSCNSSSGKRLTSRFVTRCIDTQALTSAPRPSRPLSRSPSRRSLTDRDVPGGNPNTQRGYSPLHEAASKGNLMAVKMILQARRIGTVGCEIQTHTSDPNTQSNLSESTRAASGPLSALCPPLVTPAAPRMQTRCKASASSIRSARS